MIKDNFYDLNRLYQFVSQYQDEKGYDCPICQIHSKSFTVLRFKTTFYHCCDNCIKKLNVTKEKIYHTKGLTKK